MKLYWSSRSPFARKVMICAHELGIAGDIELVRTAVKPEEPSWEMMKVNPLNKIPALVLDDGSVLYDSPVICEYLASHTGNVSLFPAAGMSRWTALRRQALADGMMDIGLARNGEKRRDHPSAAFASAYVLKVETALNALETEAGSLCTDQPTIGEISIVCALAQLDFRFGDMVWRDARPKLASWFERVSGRASVAATAFEDVR